MTITLAPKWLQIEEALGHRPGLSGSALDIREQYNSAMKATSARHEPSPKTKTEDIRVNEYVQVRLYTAAAPSGDKVPVGVYYHGGGLCGGSLDAEDYLCRQLCERLSCVIVSVDYRLAPEHKSPAQIDDAVSGWDWAFQNASMFNGDTSKYFSVGQSAGGGLAFAVANRLVAAGFAHQIRGIASLVPILIHPDNVPKKYLESYQTFYKNADAPVVTAEVLKTCFEALNVQKDNSDMFPILSSHLASFPTTYIAVCGADPLCDDGRIMNEALCESGVRTRLDYYAKLPHVFWAFGCDEEEFMQNFCAGIRFVIGL